MRVVVGVDSSTQSTKVEVRRLDDGALVARASAPHPVTTPPRSEQLPEHWWSAFQQAWAAAVPAEVDVVGLSVAGQQHGMVVLDQHDEVVRPAKLWNDTESSSDATSLVDAFGGPEAWAAAVGSVPVAAFTITKLAWLRRVEPHSYERLHRVLLPHDWLTFRLTGQHVTDRGDASGTGYFSASNNAYRLDVLAAVDAGRDWTAALPRVAAPSDVVGEWRGIPVACGTGDNMAAALGIGLEAGTAVVSIGTSGTAYTVANVATSDRTGAVAGFADATGRFLPLVCTLNAGKVLDATARLLGASLADLDALAASAPSGAGGLTMLPYLDGERTPNLPNATGWISGLRSDVERSELARAAVEGVVCSLLDALDELCRHAPVERVVLTGGGARSTTLCEVFAGLCEFPVATVDADEAVAAGAAVQAAVVAGGGTHAEVADRWGLGRSSAVATRSAAASIRARYADLRAHAMSAHE
jgi:xylulokinase